MNQEMSDIDLFKYFVKVCSNAKSKSKLRKTIYGTLTRGQCFMDVETKKISNEFATVETNKLMEEFGYLITDWAD
jgi:hypothetical protein